MKIDWSVFKSFIDWYRSGKIGRVTFIELWREEQGKWELISKEDLCKYYRI